MNRSMDTITAIVLAGGLGSRLRNSISDRPKVLAGVMGKPFLSYILNQINDSKITNVILCTGYLGNMINDEYGLKYKNLKITYSQENKPLGTGGALRLALPLIRSKLLMVMNGDSYINILLNNYIKWFTENEYSASICLTHKDDTRRFGRIELNQNDKIERFIEKKDVNEAGYINAGIYLFEKELFNNIPDGKFSSLEREFFPRMINNNIYGYLCDNKFIDIGTPESYDKANIFFNQI